MFGLALRRIVMEAADAGGASGGGAPAPTPPAQPANPPAPAAPAPGEEFKQMTVEQFNARLAKQSESGQKALLKEFGFKDVDEAKSFFAAAKADAEAKKTEQQKIAEKIAALEPVAAEAMTLTKTIENYLAIEEGLVPEGMKTMLDLAPPVDDKSTAAQKAARLDWIVKARAKGLFNAPASAATQTDTKQPPANSRAGQGNPPPPVVPTAKHPREMTPEEFRQYERQQLAAHTARK